MGDVKMRTYRDGCSSAHALDLVGERWALLIVRDLLFGPKRFTDLHAGLPQGSPNVLTQRLRDLEDSGIVRRRKLPPPASTMVYELTEWGAELEPILLGLQRWGAASPSWRGEIPVSCDAAMLALKNAFNPHAAAELEAQIEVRFDSETFGVTIRGDTINIRRGATEHPDATVQTDPTTLEHVAFGLLSLKAAERAGELRVDGDGGLVERFFEHFSVPGAAELDRTTATTTAERHRPRAPRRTKRTRLTAST
jgi:DNA-binding HxlR family transcriptional regulator